PFPWDTAFIVGALVLGTIGLSYAAFTFLLHRRYASLAEKALILGDYPAAIKGFHRAKSEERIVDVVKAILRNPELASRMSEIAKSAELEEYIAEIQELIVQET
ncbi:MAG TPA: hypothetical protein VJ044_11795, partial [Candidatus Hodarchaeales archaeon]|nr:hypothetical protein [Candidatus Hodarchaeales archaeon]